MYSTRPAKKLIRCAILQSFRILFHLMWRFTLLNCKVYWARAKAAAVSQENSPDNSVPRGLSHSQILRKRDRNNFWQNRRIPLLRLHPLSKETLSALLPLQVYNSNDGVGVEGSRGEGEQKVLQEKGRTDLSSGVDHFFPETVHHSTKQPEVIACRCLEKEKTSKNENKNPRLNKLTTFCKMFRIWLIL